MYIKDGSKEDYAGDNRQYGMPLFKNLYAWGWLDDKVESSGWEDEKLKTRIIEKLKKSECVDEFMGWHVCKICGNNQFDGSIKIPYNDKVYCSPFGVEHYIEAHNYCPEGEVIEAILKGKSYSGEDLERIGSTMSDVIRAKADLENRMLKMEKESEERRKKKVKMVQSKSFKEALNKAMMKVWFK